MRVLKFGGSSVAHADTIKKVVSIIREAGKKDKIIVVVSALGGTTDQLIELASMADAGDEDFRGSLQEAELRHPERGQRLMRPAGQSTTLSTATKYFNRLEDMLNG